MSEDDTGTEPSSPGPYADVLREYPDAERKRRRREFKQAHVDDLERKQSRRDARVKRRKRRMPFVNAGVALVGLLPLSVAAWLGERVGWLVHRLAGNARHRVLFQLRVAFPERSDAEIERIARSSFRLMGRGALSLPSLRRMGRERLLERVRTENGERLTHALSEGKGAIVVSYHFGLFEVGGAWLAREHDGVAVGRDVGMLDVAQILVDTRRDLGLTTIERGDARSIVRALRDGRPVGIVADHDVQDVNGAFVPFFGHLAHTPVGPATLAIRTGAPIVPMINVWDGRSRYLVRILDVLRPREDVPRDEAILDLTYRFTKLGEDAIRANPDHWIWLHKRWETRPEMRPELPIWQPDGGPDSVADAR